jgi:hypothetical protein
MGGAQRARREYRQLGQDEVETMLREGMLTQP